ncbi:MAG: cysteine--tRNA ligase [Candidatus Cloacimonetes bacterium]|nr:cysteine--tRNA ligase [Candidatus Cloacimonadota bacterium]MBL7107840.1 cysteine--tRNA ligase [Candidatus Cloacimonadota bacterium]
MIVNKEISKLKLYNTFSRKKEEFIPIDKKIVKMYTCGLTVYNFAHIGNLRTYIFEDILKRTLLYNGYKVKHIMNITDVGHLTSDADEGEDKIVLKAKKEKKSVWKIAEFYTKAFENDLKKLNIILPDFHKKATEHIHQMIDLVKILEKKGFTYFRNGNVYFDISKFPNYGKLAKLDLDKLRAGKRCEIDKAKKNPFDFVLWFTKSKFEDQEMKWESPWGRGYPGWHLECSAISMHYLGNHFDIHCGGIDHIAVHHTNEIAQSEAATGKKCVNFWMHGEFLIFKKEKMSKSKNEFLTLKTLQKKGFSPMVYRYFCLGAHYRQPLNFSYDVIENAKSAYDSLSNKILEIKANIQKSKIDKNFTKKIQNEFLAKINNDLNMPEALAVMWKVLRTTKIGCKEKYKLLLEFDKIFGLNFEKIDEIQKEKEEQFGERELVEKLVKERNEAREQKDWKRSDEIREKLEKLGVEIRDNSNGSTWKIKS